MAEVFHSESPIIHLAKLQSQAYIAYWRLDADLNRTNNHNSHNSAFSSNQTIRFSFIDREASTSLTLGGDIVCHTRLSSGVSKGSQHPGNILLWASWDNWFPSVIMFSLLSLKPAVLYVCDFYFFLLFFLAIHWRRPSSCSVRKAMVIWRGGQQRMNWMILFRRHTLRRGCGAHASSSYTPTKACAWRRNPNSNRSSQTLILVGQMRLQALQISDHNQTQAIIWISRVSFKSGDWSPPSKYEEDRCHC